MLDVPHCRIPEQWGLSETATVNVSQNTKITITYPISFNKIMLAPLAGIYLTSRDGKVYPPRNTVQCTTKNFIADIETASENEFRINYFALGQ